MAKTADIVELLEAGLRASALRSRVIANNIANLQTPGYRRQAVRFETFLAEQLSSGGRIDLSELAPEVFEPRTGRPDPTGNDVNFDAEFGEMIKNGAMYKTYLRLMARTYRQMELAIRQEL